MRSGGTVRPGTRAGWRLAFPKPPIQCRLELAGRLCGPWVRLEELVGGTGNFMHAGPLRAGSYLGFFETPEVLIGLTRWVRLRLRAAMWRQWKTPRRRRAALLELGVRPGLASNTAGSGLGPWYLAKAKALSVGLSNAYFKSLGLPSLFEEVPT